MSSTLFKAGRRIVAATLNAVVDAIQEMVTTVATDQNTAGTTASTSFTSTLSGGTACSTTFVAPQSGKVRVHIAALISDATAADLARMGFEVREGAVVGSGTVAWAAGNPYVVGHTGTSSAHVGGSFVVTGLTAGATYNVQQMFATGGGTGTYSQKTLSVTPCANPAIS